MQGYVERSSAREAIYTTSKAEPPARASSEMTSSRPANQIGYLHSHDGRAKLLTHDLEELLRVHALRRCEVSAGLLERPHGSADAVDSGNAGDEGEDC